MKKIAIAVLLITLTLTLSSCGGSNIEKFCDGSSLYWDGFDAHYGVDEAYYALFENGTLTIEKRTPKKFQTMGTLWTVDESYEYSYVLQGNDTVIIEGETYTYEITDSRVQFSKDLMGIEDWWTR